MNKKKWETAEKLYQEAQAEWYALADKCIKSGKPATEEEEDQIRMKSTSAKRDMLAACGIGVN